jgi:hypothetical protein
MFHPHLVAQKRVILIANLRMQFAEFLQHSYLIHLGILYPPTSVGFRYGLYVRAISRTFLYTFEIQ